MVTRRNLLGVTAGAGLLTLVPAVPAAARPGARSENGWRIDGSAITSFRVEGSRASVSLHPGAAPVLLHVARRWHYEIGPLDTGEGGGVTTAPATGAGFESNYLSGTAFALYPDAYPLGGRERLWPHQEVIVRDILLDCEGVVVWGGDLEPVKAAHFQIAVAPGDTTLARVSDRLGTGAGQVRLRTQTAGAVADPALPHRRDRARRLPRPR